MIDITSIKTIERDLNKAILLSFCSAAYEAIYLIEAVSSPNLDIKVNILRTTIANT